jgi:hypothetical protein
MRCHEETTAFRDIVAFPHRMFAFSGRTANAKIPAGVFPFSDENGLGNAFAVAISNPIFDMDEDRHTDAVSSRARRNAPGDARNRH